MAKSIIAFSHMRPTPIRIPVTKSRKYDVGFPKNITVSSKVCDISSFLPRAALFVSSLSRFESASVAELCAVENGRDGKVVGKRGAEKDENVNSTFNW
jgi:hypothetical protein